MGKLGRICGAVSGVCVRNKKPSRAWDRRVPARLFIYAESALGGPRERLVFYFGYKDNIRIVSDFHSIYIIFSSIIGHWFGNSFSKP
jgi:hypothetical protein